jgi:hypothetical protein
MIKDDIDQLANDLLLLKKFAGINDKQIEGDLKRLRALLYPMLVNEFQKTFIAIPKHIDMVCRTCRRYHPLCVQGVDGNICPTCQLKKTSNAKFKYEIMRQDNPKSKPRLVQVVQGTTFSEMVSNYGKIAMKAGFDMFRPEGKDDYTYKDETGAKMWIGKRITTRRSK